MSNTLGATCGTGSSYPSRTPEITPNFLWVCIATFLVFYVVFCLLLCVCWYNSFLPMASSVYFRIMSLNVHLVCVPLLNYSNVCLNNVIRHKFSSYLNLLKRSFNKLLFCSVATYTCYNTPFSSKIMYMVNFDNFLCETRFFLYSYASN